jgi:hypothetical protein
MVLEKRRNRSKETRHDGLEKSFSHDLNPAFQVRYVKRVASALSRDYTEN